MIKEQVELCRHYCPETGGCNILPNIIKTLGGTFATNKPQLAELQSTDEQESLCRMYFVCRAGDYVYGPQTYEKFAAKQAECITCEPKKRAVTDL